MNHGDYLNEVKVTLLEVEGENNHLGMTAINALGELMQGGVDKVRAVFVDKIHKAEAEL